jgi:ubiquitin-protein ligase
MDLKRVKIEAAELSKDSDSAGVSAKPISEDMKRWKGTITMPEDTPCVGGSFAIDIELTDYPASIFKSPLLVSFTL